MAVQGHDNNAAGANVGRSYTNFLPPPPPMQLTGGTLSENWRHFEEAWTNWSIATKLDKEEKSVIIATLNSVLGRGTLDIARNLEVEDRSDAKSVLKALKEHFDPQKNVTYERFLFNSATQDEDTIDAYISRLRKLASTCDFGPLHDSLIGDWIVIGINDNSVRRRLLRERDFTLATCIDICRAAERAHQQVKTIDGEVDTVHKLWKTKQTSQHKQRNCKYCGSTHAQRRCPANGKRCKRCNKMNHLANVCQSKPQDAFQQEKEPNKKRMRKDYRQYKKKQLHLVEVTPSQPDTETDSDSCEYEVFTVNMTSPTQYIIQPDIKLPSQTHWTSVRMQIDNGSAVNCIRVQDLVTMVKKPKLRKSNVKLTAYGGHTLEPLGQIQLDIKINGLEKSLNFQVIDNASTSLLSGQASEELKLITFNRSLLVNSITTMQPVSKEKTLGPLSDGRP